LRKTLFISYILLLLIFLPTPVFAEIVLDDSFTDTSRVDLSQTTARVDIDNNCVLLPERSLANSVDMLKNSLGYAVASNSGITLYELDDATGTIASNPEFSCPWATDATGVSLRQDNLNIWAISESSVAYYRYNGSGMSNDPALKVSGLNNVLSVTAFKNKDSALVLQADGNLTRITRYDAGGSLNPSLVIEPGISDPVAVSMVNDSPDFRLFTKDTAYYYSYDDARGTYVEDPAKRITGLPDAVSASGDDIGSAVLTNTNAEYYMNNDTGGAARVDVFSPGPVSNPVAVSLKTGTYEQTIIDGDGNVQWWSYDDAAGRMVRDPSMEITGLTLNSGYAHPKAYYSKAMASSMSCNAAYLTVIDDIPAGTSVNYYVSSDGGSAYTAIIPGTWTAVPGGAAFVLKAVLDTTDTQVTPRIFQIRLECDADFAINGYVDPQPAERGRNVTISAAAVKMTTGEPVTLDTCEVEFPLPAKLDGDPALAPGDTSAIVDMVFNGATGRWEYTFTVPEKTVDNFWPDDGVYQTRITSFKYGVSKSTDVDLQISGNILRRLVIRTINS